MVLGYGAANWLLDAAALYVAMAAFGPRPTIIGLLVAYGLANVMATIPISPGGLGVIEAILIPTLVGFGSSRSQVAIAVVVYRLVNFWTPIPVGAFSYITVTGHYLSRLMHPKPTNFVAEVNRQAASTTAKKPVNGLQPVKGSKGRRV
ncbi:YbhN family protein [Ilumatobacter sp.]|uniref:lysylphosphatidylglycerol synthase transmembrane domain-containing protein n=1 Tax=Ilumatobacter sp. TaxID=1967498 RepID=UPI0037513981